VAATVRTVKAAEGKDAADHLAAGHSLDDFTPLAVVADPQRPPATPPATVAVAVTDGAAILADVEAFLRRFVVFSTRAQSIAVALWVAHTWCFEAAETTLYLHVTSPEKQSGKTRLLEVLVLLCRGALQAADMTAAAVFRSIGTPAPTILFDEVQELFARNAGDEQKRLRAVLNAGYRHGGAAWVVEGEGGNRTPTEYPVFCPKLLAGTGSLPDMLADRSIPIRLQRKLTSERVDRLRIRRIRPEADALRDRVAGPPRRCRNWTAPTPSCPTS
jgi:hypothetical protein